MDRAFNNHILTGLVEDSPPYQGYFFDPKHINGFYDAKTSVTNGQMPWERGHELIKSFHPEEEWNAFHILR